MQQIRTTKVLNEDRYEPTGFYTQQIESLWPYGMSFSLGSLEDAWRDVKVEHWKQVVLPQGKMRLVTRPEPEINVVGKVRIAEKVEQEVEIDILNQIDPYLMIEGRISKLQKGYSLRDIKEFARRLGISSAGKRKKDLITEIIKRGQERGLPWKDYID